MRRRALFLLAMLLTATICTSATADPYMAAVAQTPEDGDLLLADALAIAKDAFAETAGEAYDETWSMNEVACLLTVELYGDTQRAWFVSLQREAEDMDRMIGVAVLSPSGEIAEVREYQRSDRRAEWEAEKGPCLLWPVEDRALFYRIYERVEDGQYDYAAPQAHDLTREAAIDMAKAALIAQKNADPEELEALTLGAVFSAKRIIDPAEAYQKDFWQVMFLREDADAPGGLVEVYCANIASPDGEVYMLYNLHEDGRLNG